MKTKILLPVFTAIVALAIVIGTSAFKQQPNEKEKNVRQVIANAPPLVDYYFQYTGGHDESDYEDPGNWTPIMGDPGDSGCPGDDIVCILKTNAPLSTHTGAALVDFLDDQPSALDYCNAAGRAIRKKSE